MAEYAHPELLVDTAWVAAHNGDPDLRLVEVDVDTAAYDQGHVPEGFCQFADRGSFLFVIIR